MENVKELCHFKYNDTSYDYHFIIGVLLRDFQETFCSLAISKNLIDVAVSWLSSISPCCLSIHPFRFCLLTGHVGDNCQGYRVPLTHAPFTLVTSGDAPNLPKHQHVESQQESNYEKNYGRDGDNCHYAQVIHEIHVCTFLPASRHLCLEMNLALLEIKGSVKMYKRM